MANNKEEKKIFVDDGLCVQIMYAYNIIIIRLLTTIGVVHMITFRLQCCTIQLIFLPIQDYRASYAYSLSRNSLAQLQAEHPFMVYAVMCILGDAIS